MMEAFNALAERLEGVRPIDDAATRHMLRVHGVEIARVRPRGDDAFEFSEDGTGPLTAIVIDGDQHDQVVAWQPDRPDKLRYLDGDRWPYLGRWYLESRMTCRRPVRIFADVETWLKAGREGVVILDWSRFDPHSDLVGIPEVYCPSGAVKSRLEGACKPRFRITVRQLEGIRNAA
jgi:hypothetical protein